MGPPRLFLVAPEDCADLIACAEAACAAGDCASILLPATVTQAQIQALQHMGLAAILRDCEPRLVHRLTADGMHVSRSAPVKTLRGQLKDVAIGVFAATSRHIAMEAADAGADYIAFAQQSQNTGEPLLAWWHDVASIPSVAFDPVAPESLSTILPQNPDFIRPSEAMWQSPAKARDVIAALSVGLA